MKWFGETEAQRLKREMTPHRHYCLVPTQLVDGTWVWLETVWRKLERGPNMRQWWTYAEDPHDLRDPVRPPPPKTGSIIRNGGSK